MAFYRKHLLVVVGAVNFLLSYSAALKAQPELPTIPAASYRYETPGVRLEGVLVERKEYGPPGYGETPAKDERDVILLLQLAKPISVRPTAKAEENGSANLDFVENIRTVQLFVDKSKDGDAQKLLGKTVIAIGSLNEAVAPSQHTKVWLDTESLNVK